MHKDIILNLIYLKKYLLYILYKMDNNTQSVENTEKTVNLSNLTIDESMNLIWNALNKANSQGVYTIDESYVIKVAHNKVKTGIVAKDQVAVAKNQVVIDEE